jgi:hypothetical protein
LTKNQRVISASMPSGNPDDGAKSSHGRKERLDALGTPSRVCPADLGDAI